MLFSPGRSPRHISSPKTPLSPSTPHALIPSPNPNPRSRSSPTVLDEDTYVAAIEKIVERDFFPDLPALRDRLDWLEALRSRDPLLIRDTQLKILERRSNPTSNSPSASVFNPDSTFASDSNLNTSPRPPDGVAAIEDTLSLDQFLRRYTSEDNESFSRIIDKVNRKRKERFGHLLEGEMEDPAKAIEFDGRDRITDGYGTSGQAPSSLEGWRYTAKNLLMYDSTARDEAPPTEEERAVRMKGLTKEINRSNTRFAHGKAAESRPKEEDSVEILYAPVAGTTPLGAAVGFANREAERLKKYDLEELRKTPNLFYVESVKKSENGYSFVRTPSPAPGVDESPFITWGEIEGTPLRLDDDSPMGLGGSSEGPHFRILCPPSRDVKAHALSREAARKLRERSKMHQKPPLHSPARGASMSPNIRSLSAAAQKFVRNAMAKSSSSVDESLRASYRSASPSTATPKAGRSLSRFGRDGSLESGSPSVREGSNPS